MRSSIEQDLGIGRQASLDEHRLLVQRPQWRHRAHFAIAVKRPEFRFAGEPGRVAAAHGAEPLEVDDEIRRQHRQRRLIVDHADDRLGPFAGGNMRDRSLLLGGIGHRMLDDGIADAIPLEIVADRGRNRHVPPFTPCDLERRVPARNAPGLARTNRILLASKPKDLPFATRPTSGVSCGESVTLIS